MKRKISKIGIYVLFSISLVANYFTFMSRKNSVLGGSDASFYKFGSEVIFNVDGCLLWMDEKNRSRDFRQYWKIKATAEKGKSTCTIIDVLDNGSHVAIPLPTECTLTSIDENAKTATITYKDAVLTINRDRAIWTTSDPNEKGGGELVGCWDHRINWYPW